MSGNGVLRDPALFLDPAELKTSKVDTTLGVIADFAALNHFFPIHRVNYQKHLSDMTKGLVKKADRVIINNFKTAKETNEFLFKKLGINEQVAEAMARWQEVLGEKVKDVEMYDEDYTKERSETETGKEKEKECDSTRDKEYEETREKTEKTKEK